MNLVPHPSTPPTGQPFKVWATVDYVASFAAVATANIWFGVGAPLERFVIPQSDEPGRADDLWKTTCFEAFLRADGEEAYREWNFSPSADWAAYDFSAYRDGMAEAEVQAPYIRLEDNLTWWALGATIVAEASKTWQLGLSVVLEEADGTKSYWAAKHPAEKPDFHDADCFALQLAAAKPA